ncbi:unnamed protein product [Psylliodes chrysocephalus]|uniref:Zasp-like motif domain-containing protein n=1 Tax=Psylliodes chrysocephalus TaxID=3402493 RepID=A0A9P0GI59_9CUCU|nr:unnamed protein product [Psylliodes chrysocephala]
MAKLVNKQFNTPIGLYSQQNIQDVLDREAQILANGAVGIDFRNPDVGKPDNLKNSAVLRMLEEEESRQRNGYGSGSDRISKPLRAWPPPDYEQKNQQRSKFKDVVIPGVKRVAWPPPLEIGQDSPYIEQNSVQGQGQRQASRPVEPPPTTITLRPQAPVSQAPPPVYTSQPATANLKGGKHLRGDLKWPPEEVKMQAEEENRLRLELAKGPVCRPRKVKKDYTSFFEQHALNSTYPGYKIPPGTQFYKPE